MIAPGPHRTRQVWLSVPAVVVLTAVAAAAPAGMRKLGLFSIVFGAAVGWIVGTLSSAGPPSRLGVLFLAPLLTVAGLVGIAVRSHHDLRNAQRIADLEHPERAGRLALLESIAEVDPATAQTLLREQRARDPDFLHYLAVRVQPLGEWSQPWPAVFWAAELVAAALCSVLVTMRTRPTEATSVEHQVKDTHAE